MVDLKKEKNMSIAELQATITNMILSEYENDLMPSDIEVRRKLYKSLKLLIGLEKLLSHHQVRIIKDANRDIAFDSPRIFTCTTGGQNDLKTIFQILKSPAWLPVSNPDYHSDFETFLFRNHFITWYDASDPRIKEALLARERKILLSGEDLICFPESSVNTGEKVNELNPEYADIIVDTSPVIIPVAIQEYKIGDITTSYVKIGRYFDLKGLKKIHEQDILTIITEELNRLKQETRTITEKRLERSGIPVVKNDTDTRNIARHLLIKK